MASEDKLHLLVTLWCVLQAVPSEGVGSMNGRKVLLVSMDGFRYDYFQKANTPHFDAMMESGVTVPYVNPTFVTLTFPTHTSMATGLYEESHGIVANRFYDPLLDSTFSFSKKGAEWWNASEPVWINAVKSGLKVGTIFWPGSDVDFNGYRPLAYRSYDEDTHFDTRIRTMVEWLSLLDFDMGALYFEEPDKSGHEYGPDDPRLVPVIERMDAMLGLIVTSLEKAGIKDKVDLIITSDHGMAAIDPQNQVIILDELVNDTLLNRSVHWSGAMVHLVPQPDKARELVEALSNVEHLHVYLREDVPVRFHYSNNQRITDVIAYADEGWIIAMNEERAARVKNKATHGFDNALMSMKTIFVASGPSFKKGYRLQSPIESVDIYPLLCRLLDLNPAPNNGSLQRVTPLLDDSTDQAWITTPSFIITLFFVTFPWVI